MLSFANTTALSFDCYGTLIDWESGLLAAFAELLQRPSDANDLLPRFARIEAELEAGPYTPYRMVLELTAARIAVELGAAVTRAETARFADSIRDWQPFPDTVAALQQLATAFRLYILSNIDDDLFAASAAKLDVRFSGILTAQQLGSYKPDARNFAALIERVGGKDELIHVAQSLFHDHVPAQAAGLRTIWINRRGESAFPSAGATASVNPEQVRFDLELPDLVSLNRLALA